jgi:poly(A) polymerase
MATTLPAPFPTDPEGAEQLLYRLGPVAYRDRLMLAWTRSGAAADDAGWMATVALLQGRQARQFPLRGRDLLAFGAAPGPGLGQLLAEIEETWIAGGFTEDREGLLALARRRLAATQ